MCVYLLVDHLSRWLHPKIDKRNTGLESMIRFSINFVILARKVLEFFNKYKFNLIF